MLFPSLIENNSLVTGDGAMGSQLMARGLEAETPGEIWNVEKPECVRAAHQRYVSAGAQYLLTNTFGANPIVLARHGLEGRLEQIVRAGVELARDVAGDDLAVLGDLGPSGGLLEPVGTLSRREVREGFERQIRALRDAGVDGIVAETFESGEELEIVLELATENCDLPLVASMKFNAEDSGRYRSIMGDGPERVAELGERFDLAVVGTNCGEGIESMVGAVEQITQHTDRPVIAQPNAGKPRLVDGETVYDQDAAFFARYLPALYDAGAKIIGGCCGTTGAHIHAIRSMADTLE